MVLRERLVHLVQEDQEEDMEVLPCHSRLLLSEAHTQVRLVREA